MGRLVRRLSRIDPSFFGAFLPSRERWFLDDAFRDGELGVLNQWTGLSGIFVDGIYPIGKGLGAGVVNDPEQCAEGIHDSERWPSIVA
jgi:hypothetical protein